MRQNAQATNAFCPNSCTKPGNRRKKRQAHFYRALKQIHPEPTTLYKLRNSTLRRDLNTPDQDGCLPSSQYFRSAQNSGSTISLMTKSKGAYANRRPTKPNKNRSFKPSKFGHLGTIGENETRPPVIHLQLESWISP